MYKSMIALAAAATLLTACTSADESKKIILKMKSILVQLRLTRIIGLLYLNIKRL